MTKPMSRLLLFPLCLQLMLWDSSTASRPFRQHTIHAAAIFGLGGNKKDANKQQQHEPPKMVPPPEVLSSDTAAAAKTGAQILPPDQLEPPQQPLQSVPPPVPRRERQDPGIRERQYQNRRQQQRQQQQIPLPPRQPQTGIYSPEDASERDGLTTNQTDPSLLVSAAPSSTPPNDNNNNGSQQLQQQQQQQPSWPNQGYPQQQQPSPPNSFWMDPNGVQLPPPPPGWMDPALNGGNWMFPPPQQFSDWPPPPPDQQQFAEGSEQQQQLRQQQQQQQYDPNNNHNNNNNIDDDVDEEWMLLQRFKYELDEALTREQELLEDLQNATASVTVLQQHDELQRRQLDVLMERIIDIETDAAITRNEMTEYQANCTELGRQVALLEGQLEEWQSKCQVLQEQHEVDEQRLEEWKEKLVTREAELEELATAVETSRLRDERDKYLEELSQTRKQKRRTWLSLFTFGLLGNDRQPDEDIDEKLQELAKSTLLRALQTERDNVDELEVIVASLQQNNSAISQMVESRDEIIEELNDRVAVFEEDKMVLKAALRQLQKEMKEEAPKTQKLIDELEHSRAEVVRLSQELESLVKNHQQEIAALQAVLLEKEVAINETESNMTIIGTYVDKLEERLASFAVARRDVEVREKQFQDMEETMAKMEKERNALREQVKGFTTEQEEMKTLLAELVQERGALQQKVLQLQGDRDKLVKERKDLQQVVMELRNEKGKLETMTTEYKANVTMVENLLSAEQSKTLKLQGQLESVLSQLEALNQSLGPKLARSAALEEELKLARSQLDMLKNAKVLEQKVITPAQPAAKPEGKSKKPAPPAPEIQLDVPSAPIAEEKVTPAVERKTFVPPVRTTIDVVPPYSENDDSTLMKEQNTTNVTMTPRVEEISNEMAPPAISTAPTEIKALALNETAVFNGKEDFNLTAPTAAAEGTVNVTSKLPPPPLPDIARVEPQLANETRRRGNATIVRKSNNATQAKPKRKFVPLRSFRKSFAKTTGMHGFFTPSSTYRPKRRRQNKKQQQQQKQSKRPPQPGDPSKLPKRSPQAGDPSKMPKRSPQPGDLARLPKRPLQPGDMAKMSKRPLQPGDMANLPKRPPFQPKGSSKFQKRPPPPNETSQQPKRPLKGEPSNVRDSKR